MNDYTIVETVESPTVLQVFPGGPTNVFNGSGTAADVIISPPISGLPTTVQEALEFLASQGSPVPSGGASGEILTVTQLSPRVVDWVNYLDGGTFN